MKPRKKRTTNETWGMRSEKGRKGETWNSPVLFGWGSWVLQPKNDCVIESRAFLGSLFPQLLAAGHPGQLSWRNRRCRAPEEGCKADPSGIEWPRTFEAFCFSWRCGRPNRQPPFFINGRLDEPIKSNEAMSVTETSGFHYKNSGAFRCFSLLPTVSLGFLLPRPSLPVFLFFFFFISKQNLISCLETGFFLKTLYTCLCESQLWWWDPPWTRFFQILFCTCVTSVILKLSSWHRSLIGCLGRQPRHAGPAVQSWGTLLILFDTPHIDPK